MLEFRQILVLYSQEHDGNGQRQRLITAPIFEIFLFD